MSWIEFAYEFATTAFAPKELNQGEKEYFQGYADGKHEGINECAPPVRLDPVANEHGSVAVPYGGDAFSGAWSGPNNTWVDHDAGGWGGNNGWAIDNQPGPTDNGSVGSSSGQGSEN
jgi:hypothetical protein